MKSEILKNKLATLPKSPGCYKFFNAKNEILYIGKAKNLKNRVSSYFLKQVNSIKTRRLVDRIADLEVIITPTEHDAFLLENSLIKHHQPKYNISLKDDKTYPFIVIKKENFPRVFLTRRMIKDGSEYIGPFTSVNKVHELMSLIKDNIPLRTCTLDLSPSKINSGKYKVCLQYHLGNCKGPCEGLQSLEDYQQSLQLVRHILKGNLTQVINQLKLEMDAHAEQLQFEKAAVTKNKIDALKSYQYKSTVVNTHLNNADILTVYIDEHATTANFMQFVDGSILTSQSIEVENPMELSIEEIAAEVLPKFRDKYHSNHIEVLSNSDFDIWEEHLKLSIPKTGDKKKLVDMSLSNAKIFAQAIRKTRTLKLEKQDPFIALKQLKDDLKLPVLPTHIECFDNSNFQGAYPVSAMVCFIDGQPSKKDYRHYNVKTVEGIDDFATMKEVVYRRYRRLVDEEKTLPQLVIIDGGKGQLGAAVQSLKELGLLGKLSVVGLAKREESIFFPGDKDPIQLPFDKPSHLLVRYIRDEVHRFGITFHRKKRSSGTFKNELENIKGIGEKIAQQLLIRYKSVNNIRTLTERELTAEIGASKARLVYDYFNKKGD